MDLEAQQVHQALRPQVSHRRPGGQSRLFLFNHFPNFDFVQQAFLYSVRFLLTTMYIEDYIVYSS